MTSRPAHLLDTIHSRCHRVPFGALTAAELERVLAESADSDGSEGHDPALSSAVAAAAGGSVGVARRLLEGIADCGGIERFEALLDGVGCERPEALVEFVPARGKETVRQRVRRLLELLLVGTWSRRLDASADAPRPSRGAADDGIGRRERCAAQALALAERLRDLDGNLSPDLILESLPGILLALPGLPPGDPKPTPS